MLVIRKEQMEALSDAMRQRFIDQKVLHLTSVFPDKLKDLPNIEMDTNDESLRELIAQYIDKAAGLDIVSEKDVARYIDFIMEFGEGFEKNRDMRWAKNIMANKRLSGSARVSFLYEQLPHRFPESRIATSLQ